MSDDAAWFAPKRFGYGAGLPIRWQGWTLLGAYLVIVVGGAVVLTPRFPGTFATLLIGVTAAFLLIAARTTRGGWRWRWGDDQ